MNVNEANCLHSLFAKQPAEHLATGQSLFFEGDDANHVYELLEGMLRVFRIVSDGRRVITSFLYPGDFIGFSLRGTYLYSAEAVTPATIRRMPRRHFETAVAADEDLRTQVFAKTCCEMAATQEQMVLLACKSAEERLCSFIRRHMQRVTMSGERAETVDLPMSRQDVADHLGLTIETVSRTFTKLINKNVISLDNPAARHILRIEKHGMLEFLAGDNDECAEMRQQGGLVSYGGRGRH
jgi:CRP/FNR family transcriptional regulator